MSAKLLLVMALIMPILLLGCIQNGSQVQGGNQQPSYSGGNGRVVLGITDAAANMGSVSSVMVTIDSVQVQSASQGWVTLSSTPTTYDLMKLKADGSTALLADAQVPEGNYSQIRLHISQVTVTDASGTHEAKLPSGELKIVGGIGVKANTTATATFDFIADESLHTTGNGQYILAPVIQVETRDDARAEVSGDGRVSINGGRIRSSSKVGMDINGNVGAGLGIASDANLSIGIGGIFIGKQSPPSNGSWQGNATDLAACTAISDQQARFSCIAQWCGSEARDYKQCYNLANGDDQLGCLSKCNPNPNR